MKRTLIAVILALGAAVLGGTSLAAGALGRGENARSFAASFEARAVNDAAIDFCRGLGPDGQKIEARYRGTMSVDGEAYGIHLTLEALVDRRTGVGMAEGRWQLGDPSTPEGPLSGLLGGGELVAVVNMVDPPDPDVDPPDPDLELQGLLIGTVDPPDPDLPAQRLVGSFTASLDEGATFPHLKGTVGDPSVGDPSAPASDLAVLVPAVEC